MNAHPTLVRVRAFALLGLGLWLAGGARAADVGPAEHYLLHCSGCHRADGAGVPGTTPSLQGLAELASREGGRAYLARVPGAAQAPLDDAALATLLNWVIERFAGTRLSPPYDAAEIARLRERPLRDPRAARALLLASEPTNRGD